VYFGGGTGQTLAGIEPLLEGPMPNACRAERYTLVNTLERFPGP
jgi:hypothetical protein